MDSESNVVVGRGSDRRRAPRPMTRSRIENIALHHIERFPTSRAGLRRVLERRAERSRTALGVGDESEQSAWIDAAIARLGELGLLDDRAFAAALTRRLRARGSSRRLIEARLADKGVDAEIRREVLDEGEHAEAAELAAASAYVRRRRLGPHRPDPELRSARRDRDLAALARAGFTYAIAQKSLDQDTPPDL
jgi:regulatory protein